MAPSAMSIRYKITNFWNRHRLFIIKLCIGGNGLVMVMSHLWVSCPTIVPGSQAYFCVYFIITSAPTNYFPLSILATATSNFFWHASLISDMLGVHVPFQGCPFGRIFILTTLSRSAAAAEANHYLGKSIKSNKIAPREQRSELDRFANQVLERLQQQTFFLQPKPPIWRWLFGIFQLLSERKTAHYLRFQSGFEACSPLTRFTGSSGKQQPAAKVWIKMFIRHLRSSHNCYFPPPQTTLPAAAKQPPLSRYGTQRVCKVRSGSFTKCHKKKAQNKKVLNFKYLLRKGE